MKNITDFVTYTNVESSGSLCFNKNMVFQACSLHMVQRGRDRNRRGIYIKNRRYRPGLLEIILCRKNDRETLFEIVRYDTVSKHVRCTHKRGF